MKEFKTEFGISNNGVGYSAYVSGNIHDKTNESINELHVSNLIYSFKFRLINCIMWYLSDNNQGLFINETPILAMETEIMQSNANDSYYIKIDDDLYPISIKVKLVVESNSLELLMQ